MADNPSLISSRHLPGNPKDWQFQMIYETPTHYYLVAVNRVLNRTTLCTRDGRTSDTKVLYSTEEL